MYAIFMTGGKQYKVAAGDTLRIEKISGEAGDKVKLDNVIAFSDADGALQTGTPYLDATVNATITAVGRGDKVIIFKFKSKKNYRKKQGHRQPYTEIEIDNFTIGGKKFGEKPEKPKEEKKEEPKEEPAEEVKEKKPAKAKAPKAEKKAEEPKEEKPVKAPKAEKPKEEKPAKEKALKAEEPKKEEVDFSKMTKADLTAKLDELGVTYLKSAKKDELIELLKEAEGK